MERNVLEFVDHLHEHFITPCSINPRGRCNVPTNPLEGYSIEMFETSIAEWEWPNGSYWLSAKAKSDPNLQSFCCHFAGVVNGIAFHRRILLRH
ncbi:hypothetical protein F5051DRAFT_131612 [Lentinula edodes]|nr:hypothetical protein F5051DRAFT_131612 [Lentinula edodes]